MRKLDRIRGTICEWLKRPTPKAAAMALSVIPTVIVICGAMLLGIHSTNYVSPNYKDAVELTSIGLAVFTGCFAIFVPHFVEDIIDAC